MFTGPGVLELQDVAEPEVAEGDVLVQVRSVGICGSELHGARHPGFRMPPLIMGHEFAGTSADGDRVVINPMLSCGHCELCAGGLRQVCRERQIIGVHRAGGFAERVAVPGSTLRPVPDWLSWDAAAMVEPAANAVHAWNLVRAPGRGSGSGARLRRHRPVLPAHRAGRRGRQRRCHRPGPRPAGPGPAAGRRRRRIRARPATTT